MGRPGCRDPIEADFSAADRGCGVRSADPHAVTRQTMPIAARAMVATPLRFRTERHQRIRLAEVLATASEVMTRPRQTATHLSGLVPPRLSDRR